MYIYIYICNVYIYVYTYPVSGCDQPFPNLSLEKPPLLPTHFGAVLAPFGSPGGSELDNYWLVVGPYPSEKYVFVSWDDEIPKIYGKNMEK